MAVLDSRFQDFSRTLAGLALVAHHTALTTHSVAHLRSRDLPAFASFAFSRVLTAVADLAGLSRGRPHPHPTSAPQPPSPPSPHLASNCLSPHDALSAEQLSSNSSSLHMAAIAVPADHTSPSPSQHREVGAQLQQPQSQARTSIEKADAAGGALSDNKNFSGRTDNVVEASAGRAAASPRAAAKRKPRERRVPTTPLGRAFGFARLGAGLALGTLQESAKRFWGQQGSSEKDQAIMSPFLTEQNAERLALALCRMRGAALKLGQMLSIQDESFLPPQVLAALETVRQGADVMPSHQLHRVISNELGSEWMSRLNTFDDKPMAAASIGQVHRAVLKDGTEVAMKVQYPGVANSIDSDIENIRRLLDYTNLIPKGLYLNQAMKVAKEELARECNYILEAANQEKFRELFAKEKGVYVPNVIAEFSSKRVLTTEFVPGVTIDKVAEMSQDVRNSVGRRLLHLTLQELFIHHFMQTDPNWSNFLYVEATDTINLIDFGAAREYPKSFVDNYLQMVSACANQDRKKVIEMSCRLGFLTGAESAIMLDAHTDAAFAVGLPFSTFGGFDFHSSNLTRRVTKLGATMLQHRLTPPPDEAYSLHRKLSGAFLACIKLRAVVPCRELFLDVYRGFKFSEQDDEQCATTTA